MAQVNKQPLKKEIGQRVEELFADLIRSLNTKAEVENFLGDILTPSEKIAIIKRLAIAILLNQGCTYGQISSVLKVSTSTVGHVQRKIFLDRGTYGRAFRRYSNRLEVKRLLTDIQAGLRLYPTRSHLEAKKEAYRRRSDLKKPLA